MSDSERKTTFEKVFGAVFGTIVEGPVTFFREKIVEPNRGEKYYYYHRKFRRVPTIDECVVGEPLCYFEANQQFKRDKLVDNEILTIVRQRKIECEAYEGPDAPHKCKKVSKDYEDASTNWFIKYGDLGVTGDVLEAFMKQKHRLIWERRHGEDKMR